MRLAPVAAALLIAQSALIVVQASQQFETNNRLRKTNDIAHANTVAQRNSDNQLSPVILLPGDGGSRLQAKLDRQDVKHHYCERKSSDWFDLWLNLSLLVPFALDCWVDK